MRIYIKPYELGPLEETLHLFEQWLIRHEKFIVTAVEKKHSNLRHTMEREK